MGQKGSLLKIVKIETITCLQIKTDEGNWEIYRRYSADNWEALVNCGLTNKVEELESAYQDYWKSRELK